MEAPWWRMRILVDRFIYQGLRYVSSRHQRKKKLLSGTEASLALMVVTVRGLGVLTTGDASVAYAWYGSAGERMTKFGSGMMIAVPRFGAARRLGLLALRSASGLGLPAARRACLLLQRSTGLVRSSRRPGESCPGCRTGWSPTPGRVALPPRQEEGLQGADAGSGGIAGQQPPPGGGRAGGGLAGGDGSIPAGAVDDHGVDPGSSEAAQATRALARRARAAAAAALACRCRGGALAGRRRPGSSPGTWRPSRG